MKTKKLPVFFIGHGAGPCFFMDTTRLGGVNAWDPTAEFLRTISKRIDETPKAIVVVSAHWEEKDFKISAAEKPTLYFDYRGFPPHTYELKYPVPGNPSLSEKIKQLLQSQGIEAQLEEKRGFDHGVFVPLLLMYPDAKIPVVQISLKADFDVSAHLELGKALSPLREEGLLIVGSGMSFHNGKMFHRLKDATETDAFTHWLTETVKLPLSSDRRQHFEAWTKAPGARFSHPREEHLAPIFVCAGAASSDPGECIFIDRILGFQVAHFQFG